MGKNNKYEIRIGNLRLVLGYVNDQKPVCLKNNIENYVSFICENIDDDVKITDINNDLLVESRKGRIIFCSGSVEIIKILNTHVRHYMNSCEIDYCKSEEYSEICEISQQTISNIIHLSTLGYHLATFVYEKGYEPYKISTDSMIYKSEELLKNDFPNAITHDEAYEKALANNWIDKNKKT